MPTVPPCTGRHIVEDLKPDPELWIDQWADEFQRIPREAGAAEPGKYHTERTPYAREPMHCLSPRFPAKRVVTMIASQLMKTQIALNWIGGCIHQAPANILVLLPTQKLEQAGISDGSTRRSMLCRN
ncbi:phage terminase large subunit family protein [Pseudomonas aeruginosa]|nr:phage terminase large subunit family protein [Pseudomonas aeruginosa]